MPKLIFISPDGSKREVTAESGTSVMENAIDNGVEGIVAECGGSMSCGTCHIYLDEETFERLGEPGSAENDLLDFVNSPRRPTSRLSCQLKVDDRFEGAIFFVPESQY
ncbi:2Fe-2S iron-sulfur cluster-binding protein [Rhizobium sp. C4]|uniref:2Fe-2S iron-sulfur cluster-binding protein n=1 Tax=Rhizobium sp. C4 TaxID=1349800 RepID=UPI001E45D78C|nr:2Fe-2S iron-sulfur cluster-binding protein [Rhizobium sp. C4]MCD2173671.1 2Fe-2S iron-sulfur cluster-binding protein [Rhizobium sp. C4]